MSTIAHSSVSARGTGGGTGVPPVNALGDTGGGTGVPPVHPPTKHSPPPIPPDKEPQLYNAFFDGQSSLVDIAREFSLSVTHLVAWTTQQHVQTKLLNVAELGRTRARLLASEGCGRAVHTLDTVSTFHMNDTGDARTTNAHAKRKDVSRKSATDMLKLGLLPLDGLFTYTNPDDDKQGAANPSHHTPRDHKPTNLPCPQSAAAHLRATAGTCPQTEAPTNTRATPNPTPCQPEGLTAHSRGVERGSASDTPGRHAQIQTRSEGVQVTQRAEELTLVPRPDPAATHHADRKGGPELRPSNRGPPSRSGCASLQ